MKKKRKASEVSPEEAVRFIEDMRMMMSDMDEPTVSISLRVPANILRAIRLKAKSEGKKYQSLMIEYFRQGLKEKSVE